MDVAVPANLRCGRPAQETSSAGDPDWAPLTFSFAGIWEIAPQALEEQTASVQVVDVREPAEFTGALGHIGGAILIPLGELQTRVGELGRDRPIVTVCRAGGRSAQAFNILRQAGFTSVANLSGGMLRWRAEGFPVEGGSS
jgi:rhodanese-related sulfurtransferase